MLCPMKMCNSMPISHDCNQEECAWWSEYFAKCYVAVDAYLKGLEDHKKKIEIAMIDK